MRPGADPSEVERFQGLVAGLLGLHFEEGKAGFLEEVLIRRARALRLGPGDYLEALAAGAIEELGVLAQELTVGETYFFRHMDQFRAFREVAVPDRLRALEGRRRLRVLSAGCASGEEPYSLAILLQEAGGEAGRAEPVRAWDLNPAALVRAARASYSPWALRETPAELQECWFREEGREFVLDPRLKEWVTFEARNLAGSGADPGEASAFDIVFCRNVIMYFTREAAERAVARLRRMLAPGGYLFLGHAETLRGLSSDFHLCHTHGTFYYQLKTILAERPAEAELPAGPALERLWEESPTWMEAIARAAQRIQALTEADPARPDPLPAPRAAGRAWDLGAHLPVLGRAVELFRRERYGDALDLVQALPPESGRDPDVLLLRAALLAQGGDMGAAEAACRRLLELDELNAGAHYLLALCCEGRGEAERAMEHDQAAAYLDPAFAMPHLHLGLLARRRGDWGSARTALVRALELIPREEPSRLLLFGGGFRREGLAELCRSGLAACGGRP